MFSFRLDGRAVLVTGAGRGLGRAVADGLNELGAAVYGTSRVPAEAEQIAERYGTSPVVLDVTDIDGAAAVIQRLHAQGAGISLLVNNAGVNVPQPAFEVTPEAWDQVHQLNAKGLFFLSQTIAKQWAAEGIKGSIVNIGSQAGIVAIEDRVSYSSSKAAVVQLTRSMAFEWGHLGIRVNTVAPTFIRTELTESTLSRPDFAATLLARIPLGRFGEPDDVVGAVAFLLGDAAALITGQTILVDGGYTIH